MCVFLFPINVNVKSSCFFVAWFSDPLRPAGPTLPQRHEETQTRRFGASDLKDPQPERLPSSAGPVRFTGREGTPTFFCFCFLRLIV